MVERDVWLDCGVRVGSCCDPRDSTYATGVRKKAVASAPALHFVVHAQELLIHCLLGPGSVCTPAK